ncbi:hypothetical protein [Gemelliphila palaticanis]|uniref:ABC-2 type transport system ATP-binding protein n=1 Tax=Gemelliphila palaticanis TaxID=81950 RepID=A0ABX2SYF7_9BACL|nr:hypothetical protein [Gemella palaticanis]MBF0714916.1 hypothetical protein [Gemella palaticanis]NYS46846.1 hypothetical protein [Gemella palaticanis]
MSLIFNNVKKKIARKKYLEVNFNLGDYRKLLVVDEDKSSLEKFSLFFYGNNKYEGNILLFENNIKNNKKYFHFKEEEYGFYNDLTVYENFKKLLKLFNMKINKEEILKLFEIAKIDNKKYKKLDLDTQIRSKLLFKYLVSKELLIIDLYKYNNILDYEEFYKYLINNNENYPNRLVIVFSESINKIANNCDSVLVISDGTQVYYGDLHALNVIKDLIIIEISDVNLDKLNRELKVDFKLIENKIIIRKIDMEKVLYYFVENNIDVVSINDFNENTNIYSDKE